MKQRQARQMGPLVKTKTSYKSLIPLVDLHGDERGLLCLGEAEAGGVGLGGRMGGMKEIGLLTLQCIFLVLMINCCPPVSGGENNSAALKCL